MNISAHFGLNVKTTAENCNSSSGFKYPSRINSRLIFQNVKTSGFNKRADVSNVIVSLDTKYNIINIYRKHIQIFNKLIIKIKQ